MLNQLLTLDAFSYLLVFSRIGTTVSVLPGLGEAYVPVRVRLLIALLLTAVTVPVLAEKLPSIPTSGIGMFLLILGEVVIGLFVGMVARVLISSLATAGTVIAFLTGFANALLFNPALQDQGSLTAVFLTLLGTMMLFVTDAHHYMIMGIVESYSIFVPGAGVPIEDFAEAMSRYVAGSFQVGMQIAAPFMVVAIMFYVSLGLLARLMPQFQVFFVGLPLQILLGTLVLSATLSSSMFFFLEYFEGGYLNIFSVK